MLLSGPRTGLGGLCVSSHQARIPPAPLLVEVAGLGKLKWYKRDPDAALAGMMELTLEERGAYNTVLDLVYSRAGDLPDDLRFIAGWLRVDVRVWKRIRKRLIECGKLFVDDGIIHNSRADAEVLRGLSRVTSAEDAGRASGKSRRRKTEAKSKQTNDLPRTDGPTGASTEIELNHNHIHNQKEERGKDARETRAPTQDDDILDIPPKFDRRPRATRLAIDFVLPDEWISAAVESRARHGLPAIDYDLEAEKFRNHWHAKSGKDGTKRDWKATWMNWCLRASGVAHGRQPASADGSFAAAAFRVVARSERERQD